jgi:hypothetical protein
MILSIHCRLVALAVFRCFSLFRFAVIPSWLMQESESFSGGAQARRCFFRRINSENSESCLTQSTKLA